MSDPGRVLVVSPQPFYEDRGTPIAVRQLVQALSDLGYATDLLTYPIGTSPEIPGVRYFRCANPLRFRSVPVGLSVRKLILDAALVLSLIGRLRRQRYVAIHALEEGAFPAAIAARALGIPLVYDMQSSLPEQLTQHRLLGTRPVQAVLRACERWLLRRADRVVASMGLAGRVESVVPGASVREWTYCSEPRQVLSAADAAALRDEIGVRGDQRVVLYAGTLAEYQGIDLLLGAVARLRSTRDDVVLVLAGGNPDEQDDVRRAADRLGLGPALRVLGRQPRDRIPALLQLADVLVSPRCFGGNLPLKIFDYLAAGRPIVATDIETHRAVLDERCAVLVPPSSARIAEGIERVIDDAVVATALSDAARAVATERFGRSAFVGIVDALYGDVLGIRPAGAAAAAADEVPTAGDAAAANAAAVRLAADGRPAGPEYELSPDRSVASGSTGF